MTSIDKLSRSFDFLKIPTQLYDVEQRKQDVKQLAKKEKITHLNLIYDNIVSPNVRQADEWTKMISFAIEAYLVYFDDDDQDVYFVADECLNKTVKTLLDSNLIRLQYDLYRFMRKNGPERSLRGALVRFADLSHLIKSHKCRMFVELLTKENILSKIATRPEESIQSVLVGAMSKICGAFCWSMTDIEVKSLIQSFMINLSNDSSVNSYRRVSANCLSIICLFSRSPFSFFYYLHEELLKLVLPFEDNKNVFTIWGVLTCYRFVIIHLAELDKSTTRSSQQMNDFKTVQSKTKIQFINFKNLCEIYELCIYYLNSHDDNRILNAALECVQVLLKYLPFRFDTYLTQATSHSVSFLSKYCSSKEEETISNEFPIKSNNLIGSFYSESDAPMLYLIRLLSFRFLLNDSNENKLKSDTEIKVFLKAIAFECSSSVLTLAPHLLFSTLTNLDSSSTFIYDLIDYIHHSDDKMKMNSCVLVGQLINVILIENDGNYDEWLHKMIRTHFKEEETHLDIKKRAHRSLKIEILLNHLIRFIKSDTDTNNMCKRYALNALHSCLPTMLQTKYASYVLHILLNLIHLRHSTYNLVKCELVDLISSLDFKTVNYIESVLSSDKYLLNLKENEENKCVKTFMCKNTQENLIKDVFVYLLGSEDGKLRLETAKSLTRFISNMNFYETTSTSTCSTSNQKALMSIGEHTSKVDGYARNTFSSSLIDNDHFNLNSLNLIQTNLNKQRQSNYACSPLSAISCMSSLPLLTKSNNLINNNFIQPFHSLIKYWPSTASFTNSISPNVNPIIENNLNYVVPILIHTLLESIDKNQFIGCLEALDLIFQTYSPAIYYSSLSSESSLNTTSNYQQLNELLNLTISFLKHPLVAFDLYLSDILNRLIGNLFCSYSWLNMKRLDKLVQQLNFTINSINNTNNTGITQATSASLATIQSLIETLTNSIKVLVYSQSQAELITGLTYTYPFSFNDSLLKQNTDKLFVHLMRMLCVFSCVIDETSLPSSLTTNLITGSTTINPSNPLLSLNAISSNTNQQIDQKSSLKFNPKETLMSKTKPGTAQPAQTASPVSTPNEENSTSSLPKTASNIYVGNFQNSSVYLRIYEVTKASYSAYKKAQNVGNYDKFLQIIKSTLNLFAQLVESSLSVHEIGPHLDEILLYLRIIFTIEPSCAVKCVTLCLKSLFNLNLAGLTNEYIQQQLVNANNSYSILNSNLNSTNNLDSVSLHSNSGGGGLTNALSTSLTSLTSYSNQTLSMIPIQTTTTTKSKEKSSVLATIVTNQLNQFTRYMYTQSLMLKSENLSILQMQNPAIDLSQLNSHLNNFSSLPVTSSSSISSQSNVTTVSKVSTFSANPFSFFSMIRKSKETTPSPLAQQQFQKEQKLKQQKTDHKTITQYIKSFETIVIKSLRQYTFTTSVNLQTRILELLTQLIYLKVDYSLLDSDKVFFDYVLKQFDHLEQRSKTDSIDLDDNGSNLLSKSYAFDLYENFDSESSLIDPLNPFDLDTMINKLCSNLNSSQSSYLGASGSSKTAINALVAFNSTSLYNSPIVCSFSLKQQEHQRNHLLIPKLFDFLILLSHEKKLLQKTQVASPSKSPNGLLTIPEVMQLCENLIASENSPHTHAIPALRLLVIDLFLNRTIEDTKELDIQQDVLIKSMLRLIQYPQIWSLLYIAVLKYKRDTQNEDKYRKVSRHICDAIFDAMRSNLNQFKLKFKEFNGHETRAVRRYSRTYISWIESLKKMFLLLGSLAPQVFRPIDFILLSLFEISRPYLSKKNELNSNEINNWLCIVLIHLFLLLSHCNEEQILIRLYHLMPEINSSYNGTSNQTHLIRNRAESLASSIGTTTRSTASTTRSASPVTSSASSSVSEPTEDTKRTKPHQNKSNYLNYKSNADYDHDLNEAAAYLAKFLLKVLDKVFSHLNTHLKFNSSVLFSFNLSASSASTLLRDFQINSIRDLNHTQHLVSNYLLFLMYMINIGSYGKMSCAINSLISNKNEIIPEMKTSATNEDSSNNDTLSESINKSNKDLETEPKEIDLGSLSQASRSASLASLNNEFNFDSSQFVYKINRIVLFKVSKTNPLLCSMWQYFLMLANYQDVEYWSASIENLTNPKLFSSRLSSPNELDKLDQIDPYNIDSCNASNTNSLNHQTNQDQASNETNLKLKIKSRLNYCHKHNMRRDENSEDSYDNSKLILPLKGNYIYHSTLNEQLFKYASIAIYCENLSIRNQLDNTTGLAMLLINSLVELFELSSHETNIVDLFSSIHRNAYASSLFIHCINSNWSSLISKRKLYLLHSCLKAIEGVHLSASGNLLNLVIDKYFHLPYLSLVRYADHIACQRIEMMLSLSTQDLLMQLSEEQIANLNKYFLDFKYSFRHNRLISLLEQLQSSLNENSFVSNEFSLESPTRSDLIGFNMKSSPSIDFFLLYVNNSKPLNLDKEWYYNIVRSACCHTITKPKEEDLSSPLIDHNSLKSKQCALILANLDYENAMSILSAIDFKVSILKDCIELGAKRTELSIQKLPSALKQAANNVNLQKDFMHQLWLASTNLLFDLLNKFCLLLPKPPVNTTQSNLNIYEGKLNDLSLEYDFETYIAPITESINAYLRCIRQYPSLLNQLTTDDKMNSLITFILFQIDFIRLLSNKKDKLVTFQCLNESFLCLFNLLIDNKLLNAFCQRANYSTSVSLIIENFYHLLMNYFFNSFDANLISTPHLTSSSIDYENFQNHDLLFSLNTLQTLLKLRFIITNHRIINNSHSQEMDSNKSSNLMIYSASTSTHRFLQSQTHYFRQMIPFSMRDLIEKLFLSLCRLPVLDRFIRIPDSLWSLSKFKLEYNQFMPNDTSTLPPLDCLRDPLVLKEHLRHILSVGWTTRTQFEYEYVNLLTLLHNLSDESFIQATSSEVDAEKQRKFSEGLPAEEIRERNKCICLVVKGLSSWLVKSTLTPKSGSSLNSLYEQVSRNKVPQFLYTQLGKQYSQIKRIIETFSRNNQFSKLNSISLANNINLLHMLDPIIIDDIQLNQNNFRVALDFTQPQPTADALANLVQVSMNLNERDHNIIFSTNIERTMTVNLPSNADSYYYFTQISLEGYLKFLGLWNKNQKNSQSNSLQPTTAASIAASFSNFVTNTNIDEVVASKTASAINNIIKVAEFFAEDTDLLNENSTRTPTESNSSSLPHSQLIQRSFNRNNLDITSVLRTVLDYYETFFRQPCPQLKLDIFKSMLYLGNSLFDSKQQYESLINKLLNNFEWLNSFIQQEYDDQSVMPIVNELIDDSILATGIYADALCRCCLYTSKNDLQLSSKDFERLNKMFENGFKSNSLAIKIATCHGIIYWLEAVALGFLNTNDAKQITDHLCKQITQMKEITIITSNPRFISTLWAAVFYAIENCLDSIRDAQSFVSIFIKQTYTILNDPNTPYFLFHQLYMGLERFLLSSMIPSFEVNSIQRLLTSKFHDDYKSLCLTSLTLTSLYAENQSKHVNYWNDIINQNSNLNHANSKEDSSPIHQENPVDNIRRDYPQILELSSYPDLQSHLLKVLEVATNFLDRMKLSATAKEASIYAKLLPKILCDFLPPHDLLNKLITEFLNSSQHPYPEAVAYVLFKCFDLLQEKGLQSQIQEWCLLSLTNFLQRSSIYESIWLSSCLLVSATQNAWLKSTFPFLLNRYCCFETIDRAIFYMSVIEFRKQFSDKSQLNSIYATFESVAKPNTPYAELIKLIGSNEA